MREVIKQASTVEEAINLALQELNLSREDVTAEVLEYPEKKFFFKKPAKVKVSELENDFNVSELFSQKAEEKKPVVKSEEIIQPKQEKPQPKQEKPKQENQPASKPISQPKKEQVVQDTSLEETEVEVSIEQASDKARYAIEFLDSIVSQFFKGEYKMQPIKTQTGYIIKIVGEDAGSLIGRKGETMEALSYLTSLAANRSDDSFEKISVDVADYRQKREKDLKANAKKIADKVLKTGRAYTFEPMNPYERRIIHATVGEIEGVKSESKGEGSQRRVVVFSATGRKPRPQGDRANGEKRFSKPYQNNHSGAKRPPFNKDRRDKAPAPAQKTREEKMVDNAGTALYSKIEL